MNYYYSKLSHSQKNIYDAVVDAALNFEHKATFSGGFRTSSNDLQKVIIAIQQDRPDLFYLEHQISITGGIGFGTAHLKYLYRKDDARRLNSQLRNAILSIANSASKISGEYEKVLFVHDYLAENVVYDLNAPNAHNAYGALVDKRAVCQGISYAFKLVMDALNIECIDAIGEVNTRDVRGPHGWNLVRVNGRWYHIDVTLDMKQNGTIFHTYFLINDEDVRINHRYTEIVDIPCKSINDNYFFRNKAYFASFDEAGKYIAHQLKKTGRAEVKMLKIGTEDATSKIMNAVQRNSFLPIGFFVSSYVEFQIYCVFKR